MVCDCVVVGPLVVVVISGVVIVVVSWVVVVISGVVIVVGSLVGMLVVEGAEYKQTKYQSVLSRP